MVEHIKKHINYIILIIFCLFGLFLFCGHSSNLLIDVGREVYYPKAMLEGQVLYKDLFNIYGPLAYQINAFLYTFLGTKLSTLYISGYFCSISIVLLVYTVSKRFLSEYLSLIIGIFTAVIGIYTPSIFCFHFPYSWAILYGIVAFLISLLFLSKFDETKNNKFLYIGSLFCGICITCKYDFLIYSLVVLFFIFKYKNIKALLCFLLVPFISFGILFLQGLRLSDLLNTADILHTMANSQTLKYFYQNSGIYFHPKALFTNLFLFFKFALPFCLMLYATNFYKSKKFISAAFFIVSLICFWFFFDKNTIFGFLPLFTFILTCLNYKKLNTQEKILIFSAIAVSLKVFWILLIGSYGTYYAPILLISAMVLFGCSFTRLEKGFGDLAFCVTFIFVCFLLFSQNIKTYNTTNYPIKTTKGTIITTETFANSTNSLIKYIETLPKGDIVIFPEGMFINFITNRKTDGFYNSMLPLYVESFGENKIVEHFAKNKPKYIILSNLDMKDYYFRYICTDYALDFCTFVSNNYNHKATIGENLKFLIFEKK